MLENPHGYGDEGDERIRTAVCALSTVLAYAGRAGDLLPYAALMFLMFVLAGRGYWIAG